MSLRLLSLREVEDESEEEKDHLSHGHGSTSPGYVKKVIDVCNQGDKYGEGNNYGNLGNAYCSLSDLKKAIEYCNLHLKISKEVGDKHGEGNAYSGNLYWSLGDCKKAIEYYNLLLKTAQKVGHTWGG